MTRPFKHTSLAALAGLALLTLTLPLEPAEAGRKRQPYCSDACSSFRPCTKVCRLDDTTVGTCGDVGECDPLLDAGIVPGDVREPVVRTARPKRPPREDRDNGTPRPEPTPAACAAGASQCLVDGVPRCSAVPGFLIKSTMGNGMLLKFEAHTEGIAKDAIPKWQFGDGATATGMNVDHEYKETKIHRIVMRVTDSVCGVEYAREISTNVPIMLDVPANPKAAPQDDEE